MKKILVLCSRNKRRSLTAEQMYRHNTQVSVRSAGTSPQARHQVSTKDVTWADVILCMQPKHKEQLRRLFAGKNLPPIVVADIPDEYTFMDPELCELLEVEIEALGGAHKEDS